VVFSLNDYDLSLVGFVIHYPYDSGKYVVFSFYMINYYDVGYFDLDKWSQNEFIQVGGVAERMNRVELLYDNTTWFVSRWLMVRILARPKKYLFYKLICK